MPSSPAPAGSRRLRALGLGVLALLSAVACGAPSSSTATATTTGDASTSAATSESDGAGFLTLPDAGGLAQCDPGLQDCPEGEKCTPYAADQGSCCVDSTRCAPLTGELGPGEACTREAAGDDCALGLFCLGKSSGDVGPGICVQLCDVNDPAACPGGACIPFNDGLLPLCEAPCDPLVQDCEGADVGCYAVVSGEQFICSQSDYDEGAGDDGDACYTIQSCKPGLACVRADLQEGCAAERCCTPVCELSGDGSECPAASEACVSPWPAGEAPPEYSDVGMCVLPE
ncbi:MAG: hypothetical protein KC486_05640 [Myxococcales bacterium]|nr:hypothetical protein [Myxococcales bacterium]